MAAGEGNDDNNSKMATAAKNESSSNNEESNTTTTDNKKSFTWWLKTSGSITVFLIVGLGTTALWFFSTLYPIITQPTLTQLGKEPELAGPRLNQEQLKAILETYSIDESMFNVTESKVEGVDLNTGVAIYDLGDLAEELAPVVVANNFTYDEAANLAYDLNQASVENGACKLINTNAANFGTVLGDNENQAKFTCVDMTETTQTNIMELFELRKDHCMNTNLKVSTLFEHCLVANALTFSFYMIGGSATYDDLLDCTWSDLKMTYWSSIDPKDYSDQDIASFSKSFGSKGSTFRASMEQYHVKCSSGKSKPEIRRENGFIATEEMVVEQNWDRSDYYQVKLNCDAANGSMRSIESWEGDVMIGTLQMISYCKDNTNTPDLNNPKDCFDYIYNSLPPDSVGVQGFTPIDNYNYAIETLELAWSDGITPEDWTERFEGFQLQCPRGYYLSPETGKPRGVCWNAWRYVFGWGYDTKTVIGQYRWDIVGPALYRSGTLNVGTQYSSKQICYNDQDEDEDEENEINIIFEHTTLGNFRSAGTIYEVTPIFRLANVLALVVIMGITILATKLGDNSKHFFILGIFSLVALGSLWLFETAVNIEHSDMCEMRVSGLFSINSGISSVGVWFSQGFDRITIASVAVAVTQGIFWISNPIAYNTGEMPSFVSGCIVSAGFLYAIFVGAYGLLSTNACAAWYGLHDVDIFLPVLISIFLLPLTLYGLVRSPADLMLVKYGLEKPMVINDKKTVLYKKPRTLLLTDPRFGLKLYGHKIKKGTVMLTVNGIEVEKEIKKIAENEGPRSLYTTQSSGLSSIKNTSTKDIMVNIPEVEEQEIDVKMDDALFEDQDDEVAVAGSNKTKDIEQQGEGEEEEQEPMEAPLPSPSSSLRYRPNSSSNSFKKQKSYTRSQRSLERINSIMTANDEKLEGTFLGDKLMENTTFEDDSWYVYLIKLIFVKDGIA